MNPPNVSITPAPTELALLRIAKALEEMVKQKAEPAASDIAVWLSRIDPEELSKEVLKRGTMVVPPMEMALSVLIGWARGVGP